MVKRGWDSCGAPEPNCPVQAQNPCNHHWVNKITSNPKVVVFRCVECKAFIESSRNWRQA